MFTQRTYTFLDETSFVSHALEHCQGSCRVVQLDTLTATSVKVRVLMTAMADNYLISYTKDIYETPLSIFKGSRDNAASSLAEVCQSLINSGLRIDYGVWSYEQSEAISFLTPR